MSYPCAHCGTTASAESGCPSCGRGPDLDAVEVMRADAEIVELNRRHADARRTVLEIEAELGRVWNRRNAAAARVRAGLATAPEATAPKATKAPPEASSKTVQNVLFILGGLLLAIAATVFTAVAWAQFGVGGRAAVLALVTAAALAVPAVALRRGLTATAETFAAVGLLLLLLDGYAAWQVNLFGVADGSAWGYAAAVCAVTAAVAVGYEHVSGLSGPRFAALLVAHPVLPLLAAIAEPGPAGWALAFAGVAALDVAVLAVRRGGLGVAALAGGITAATVAVISALLGLFDTLEPFVTGPSAARAVAPAAGALLVTALVVVAGGVVGGHRAGRAVTAALLVIAGALAAGRLVALLSPAGALLDTALVALVLAVLVTVAVPRKAGPGPWVGAVIVLAAPALVAAGTLVTTALLFDGRTDHGPGWPECAALVVVAAGTAVVARFGPRVAALAPVALLLGLLAVPGATWAATPQAPVGVRVGVLLGVAALLAAVAWLVLAGWPGESRAAEAAAHTGALLALLLADGSAERAAAVCALWGLVLGVRAWRPAGRTGYLIAAAVAELAGWVLVIAAAGVSVLEAYTIPAAAVALLAGLLLRRARRGPSSWVAYGPALAVALLPSLVAIMITDEQHLRRLLLGLAAVAVVLAGAAARLRAPVVLGGGVLVLTGLHELALVWDLVPRWIPLAAAGLLLVLLATTLERRRRDLHRFRNALHRMT